MSVTEPRRQTAQEREAGVTCTACSVDLVEGDAVAICRECGSVHHDRCWNSAKGCSAYECVASTVAGERLQEVAIRVTAGDLRNAVPLQPAVERRGGVDGLERRWNRTGVGAFVVSLLGVPLFGIVTGIVAMILACVALVGHRPNQRGMALAAVAMVIGLADIVGWAVGLSYYLGSGSTQVAFSEMAIDSDSLDDFPSHIARAMRANVIVNSKIGFGRSGMGSGVVLRVVDGLSYIVTNRHVIDGDYTSGTVTTPSDLSSLARLTVGSIEAIQAPATVEWVAPHGVDLAVISARFPPDVVSEAHWNLTESPVVGDEVFAIGNPHGLGWTHTSGSVSQMRRQTRGGYSFRVLQTSAAINSGNSGGGLYDTVGQLVGINTMTAEKRVAEGLGFSIAYDVLVDLIPERFGVGQRYPEAERAKPEARR